MTRPAPSRLGGAMAVMAKEWAQIWRDPSTIGLVLVLPLLLMFLFGSAVSLDTRGTRTGIVDLDRSAASRDLVAAFARNRYFDIEEAPAVAPLERAMLEAGLRGIVVIPDGFGAGLASGRVRDIQVLTDGGQPNTAAFVAGHARGLLANWSAARLGERGAAARPAIELNPRYRYNPGLRSRYTLVPGAIAIVMAMIGTMLTALIIAREYERGTMEGLLATPIPVPLLVAAKLLPYFLLGLAATAVCVGVAIAAYDLPFEGSFGALLAISATFLSAVLGQGLLISAGTRNQFVSTQFALLSGFLPSLLLSGFLFEIESMPQPIQWLTWIVPARYLIPPLQSVFLAGDIPALIWPNAAIMAGFGAFFFWRVTKAIGRTIA
ncbi:MAG: ABC transporter permease [Novosphingobium sp.]|nr:ABC transporter permease [Novosphingobium sp.]